ncbi:hypothetical protein O6H91_16G007800 [Diphasiastrum complanatum]|uniref:Uncharacterized protein n=1 Tax=Diphasiastrum complanatum TaxID=34168 RepID=A0ACC2BAN6_DIPCM|nr:hypothetical protein O6H91_Y530500 [Diphasiastrum complanatum]KAJ7526472.1 hypothetical protein O6H91_16G007800 [Diphasiastrum complanatum]
MVASSEDGLFRCSSDTKLIPTAAAAGDVARGIGMAEADHAKCECCGLLEECTQAYVERVRGVFCSHFICGLCAEAVKEDHCRMRTKDPVASVEDALHTHMTVCLQFNCTVREDPAVHVATAAAAMRQLFLRRIQSSKRIPTPGAITRSSSCLPAIGGNYS